MNDFASAAENGRTEFPELSTRELKRLFNHNSSITALSVLWILGAILTIGLAVVEASSPEGSGMVLAGVLVGIALFQLVTVVGCFRREPWARVCGIVVCVLMLVNIPIGTLLGLLGLVAFARGAPLFGPGRYVGKELKAELKHRKRNKIA